jgi:hypothetical protein
MTPFVKSVVNAAREFDLEKIASTCGVQSPVAFYNSACFRKSVIGEQ